MRAIVLLVLLVLLCAVVAGPTAATPEVTFNREIVPLLQQHCQECHRAGGGAPFVLERYEHVYQRRDKILESVEKRHMPPWKAVSGYGDLLGGRRLSDAEIATVARWVAGGAPEGAPGDRPAPRKFANAAGIACVTGTWGEGGVAQAALLHLVSSSRNFSYPGDSAYNLVADDYITQPLEFDEEARLAVPHGHGLGVEPDWAKVEKYSKLEGEDRVFAGGGQRFIPRARLIL